MYPVSNAFLTAVKKNTRKYYWTGQITTTSLRRSAVVLQAIQIIYRWEIDNANYRMLFGYRPEDRLVSMILL